MSYVNLLKSWKVGSAVELASFIWEISVYSRLAGYEDTNDAERLSIDPAIRHLIGGRAKERQAASTSQMGRFETEILTQTENLELLTDLSGKWGHRIHEHKPPKMIIIDMDSSDSPTFGKQEGSAYNAHFGYTCYHPLFVFNQFGDSGKKFTARYK